MQKWLCGEMQEKEGCWLYCVPGKGHVTRAIDPIRALVERRSVERKVLHRFSDVLACSTDQNRSFVCPQCEQGSIGEVCDAERYGSHLLSSNNLNNFENIEALMKRLCNSDIALVCLRTVPVRELHETILFKIFTIQAARKDIACSLSNALLKIINDFTTATNEESRRTLLVSLFARLPSLSASDSAIGRPSWRVTKRSSRGASTHATSTAF